jgi:hypothetical protein
MALTKVTKSGLADDSVDASKLEDGTIVAADINDGTITNAKLAGSIANAKLANSTITLNGSSLALGGSATVLQFQWQSVVTTDTTMVSGRGYFVNTTSGAITMTLPASPSAGDYVAIKDYAATFQTNNLTIARNGSNIQGVANNSTIDTTRASVVLVYADATKGWLYTNESNVADLEAPAYITATGGTETTSGDYKIHSFTSSGCFAVSQASNQSHTVEYLVVAGGGGGEGPVSNWAGGGGGAGGFRTNYPSPDTGGTAISAQTYPITVGAGGAGDTANATGSNSIFSTITSAGGGGGASAEDTDNASPGGSGGGGGAGPCAYGGGTGNTPPVSPPQGNSGGNGSGVPGSGPLQPWGGGGGGGAGTAGSSVGGGGSPSPGSGANGGNGTANSITGSSVTYAGGGGGGTFPGPAGFGAGGPGGGGRGVGHPGSGTAGSANTGGGGGGHGECSTGAQGGQSGGSGVVILRYKYQN